MTQRGAGQYIKYDAENRPVKVSSDSGGGVYVARMSYDGDGQRRKRVDNYDTIHYVGPHYDRNAGNGSDTTEVTTRYYYAQMGKVKRLVALRKASTLYYVVPDHLGGTLRVVDTSGNAIDDIRYHAFGATRSGGTNTPTDKKFTGQTLDQSTGLYDYGARAYDAYLGRFIQPDSLVPQPGNPQSLNRYSYVRNNPLRYTDPSGHDPIDSDWENDFTVGHGKAPTDDDRLDRLYSFSTGRAWTAVDWQQYTSAKQAGTVNPTDFLVGTRGSMKERIKIASALVMLKLSGPRGAAVYNQIVGMGTSIRFGGGLFDDPLTLFRLSGSSIGYDNAIFLDPSLMNDYVEAVASTIAHEAYHAQRSPIRYPFSRSEEVQAYIQEAQVWENLRVSYKGSNPMYDQILGAYEREELPDYVGSQAAYKGRLYRD